MQLVREDKYLKSLNIISLHGTCITMGHVGDNCSQSREIDKVAAET
jgi:hypothetical protein